MKILGPTHIEPSDPVAGETFLVQVCDVHGVPFDERPVELVIFIDGVPGARQYLQAARPGLRRLTVVARRGDDVELATVEVKIQAVDTVSPTSLRISHHFLPTGRLAAIGAPLLKAYAPAGEKSYARRFSFGTAVELAGTARLLDFQLAQPLPNEMEYRWDFGDGTTITTEHPWTEHDFESSLDPERIVQNFHIRMEVWENSSVISGFTRTLSVINASALIKQTTGKVYVSGVCRHTPECADSGDVVVVVSVRNVEPAPMLLTSFRATWVNPNTSPADEPWRTLNEAVSIAAKDTKDITVNLPANRLRPEATGVLVTLRGTCDGRDVVVEVYGAVTTPLFRGERHEPWAEGIIPHRRLLEFESALESPVVVGGRQSGWMWCNRCEGLFFVGKARVGTGVCAHGDGGVHDPADSGDYMLVHSDKVPGSEGNWRYCHRCAGLFFGPETATSICPAGGTHDASRSGPYSLMVGPVMPKTGSGSLEAPQAGWLKCWKCRSLFFGARGGVCPRDHGRHDGTGSAPYHVGEIITPLMNFSAIAGAVALLSPVEGQEVDATQLTGNIAEGWALEYVRHETRPVEGHWANARKGDALLAPGGSSPIAMMLRNLSVPQLYSHTGIITRDQRWVTHSTADSSRTAENEAAFIGRFKVNIGGDDVVDEVVPIRGFRPDIVQFGWPGVITQDAEDAIFGRLPIQDPEFTDRKPTFNTFDRDERQLMVGDAWRIVPPLLVRPSPDLETPEIRQRLHEIADSALDYVGKSHYRFYCYTDPHVAYAGRAPQSAGWAAGTFGTVCSSFVWTLFRQHNVPMGPNDGLAQYRIEDRRAGAETLYAILWNKGHDAVISKIPNQSETLNDLVGDPAGKVGRAVGNQILNSFARDRGDDQAWADDEWRRTLAEAYAVSPDDMLKWYGPEKGGLYGSAAPAIYIPATETPVAIYRWKRLLDRTSVTLLVTVTWAGEPVPHADVTVNGTTAGRTDTDGNLNVSQPLGQGTAHVVVRSDRDGRWLGAEATVALRAPATEVLLELDEVYVHLREVRMTGSLRVKNEVGVDHVDLYQIDSRDTLVDANVEHAATLSGFDRTLTHTRMWITGTARAWADGTLDLDISLNMSVDGSAYLNVPFALRLPRGARWCGRVVNWSEDNGGGDADLVVENRSAISTASPGSETYPMVFEHGGFNRNEGGHQQALFEGSYASSDRLLLARTGNGISSVSVPDGWVVTAYPGVAFQGQGAVYTADVPYVGDGLNDNIRSIRVERYLPLPVGMPRRILVRHSMKFLEVPGASSTPGVQVRQAAGTGQLNQYWLFQPASSGHYYIVAACNGLVLEVAAGDVTAGATVQLGSMASGSGFPSAFRRLRQMFKFVPDGEGWYSIEAAHGGLALNIAGGTGEDGAPVILWPRAVQTPQAIPDPHPGKPGVRGVDNQELRLIEPENMRFRIVSGPRVVANTSASPENLGGGLASGPACCSWSPGRLDVFVRGLDDALWHKYYEEGWSEWETLGGGLSSEPAAVSWAAGRIDVFVRGSDNALWHKFFEGGWSDWESLGGGLSSGPAVASWKAGRLDVFVRGLDDALWHKYYEGGWSDWESVGGGLSSEPAAVSWADGRIDVFVRGLDNALWHKFFWGGWSDWESLGGQLSSGPAVASWKTGRLDVFAQGFDGTLLNKSFDGGWSEWKSLGHKHRSTPDAVSRVPGYVDVFYRGVDDALWHVGSVLT